MSKEFIPLLICLILLFPWQSFAQEKTANGVVVSQREVTISSQVAARISDLQYREGSVFEENVILVAFDCAQLKASAAALWAKHRAANRRHRTNAELDRAGAIGKEELAISLAESESAAAQATALDERLEHCTIRSPFAGRVVEIHAEQFSSVAENQEILSIVDHLALEIDLIVPSMWLAWIKEGTALDFAVYETGQEVAASVSSIGAVVDPVSRTVAVKAVFTEPTSNVLPGMSGVARFESSR